MFKKILFFFLLFSKGFAQKQTHPIARFSFNYEKRADEINKRDAKLTGVKYTQDRFGNNNCAVFLSGSESSYINLGNYKELKPKVGSISLWLQIEHKMWAGKGTENNPIIVTKARKSDDFYEAYGIYYMLETGRCVAVTTKDSTKEVLLFYMEPIERNNWHHLVITYNYSWMSFYVDGKLESRLPKNFETEFLPEDSVLIGSTGNLKNHRFLNAAVDDIEFYDKVLTEKEVVKLYQAPNPNKNKIILNWIFICACFFLLVAIIIVFIKLYIKTVLKKEKQKLELSNKLLENELRINRALMNPHFVFNSLNTLNHYILTNNNEVASDYLVKFSKLIRKILDSNVSDNISLEQEIELIHGYLEIEGMRFKEDIKYELYIDPTIILSSTVIPIMMVQPFVENSVWHGLRDKKGDKTIHISFSKLNEKYIECVIDDNGTGRRKKEPNDLEKKSLATGFVMQRLELLNKIHNLNCSLSIIDKENGTGTIVNIILPILNK